MKRRGELGREQLARRIIYPDMHVNWCYDYMLWCDENEIGAFIQIGILRRRVIKPFSHSVKTNLILVNFLALSPESLMQVDSHLYYQATLFMVKMAHDR